MSHSKTEAKSESFEPLLTPRFIAEALGLGQLHIPPAFHGFRGSFNGITTDSRKIQPGCLFVAIPGEKFDGHEFIPQAIEKGAAGVICRRDFPMAGGDPQASAKLNAILFRVENTVQAFRKLALAWRKQFSIPVVLVAGSVGKTTTKEILAALLEGKWPGQVLKTRGSQNGFVGIPMTLLELKSTHRAAVIEVGIDEIGAMEQHVPLVQPTASLLTAIGPEHLEKLRDVPTVAQEEGIALTSVAALGGLVAICLDDPWIRPHAVTLKKGVKLLYTLDPNLAPAKNATGELVRGSLSPQGRKLKLTGAGLNDDLFDLPLPGSHNALNCLAAITVARGLGLSATEIRRGLKTFQSPEGRSQVKSFGPDATVICDYYNANPTSVEAALRLLTDTARAGLKPSDPTTRERWACLGDMLELGPDEERFHRELAPAITTLGIEHVLLYGPRMQALQEELEAAAKEGWPGRSAHYQNHSDLARDLAAGVRAARKGFVALVKGSRGMRMEEVWKRLEPELPGAAQPGEPAVAAEAAGEKAP